MLLTKDQAQVAARLQGYERTENDSVDDETKAPGGCFMALVFNAELTVYPILVQSGPADV